MHDAAVVWSCGTSASRAIATPWPLPKKQQGGSKLDAPTELGVADCGYMRSLSSLQQLTIVLVDSLD
jgi:hypothetical protein